MTPGIGIGIDKIPPHSSSSRGRRELEKTRQWKAPTVVRTPTLLREVEIKDLKIARTDTKHPLHSDVSWSLGFCPSQFRCIFDTDPKTDDSIIYEYRIDAIDYHEQLNPDNTFEIRKAKLTVTKWEPVQKRLPV